MKILDLFKRSKPKTANTGLALPGLLKNQNMVIDSAPSVRATNSVSSNNFLSLANTQRSGGKSRLGLQRYQNNLVLDHYALRQNTRYALHDSSQARTIVKRYNDSVIGNGLKLEPTPEYNILGISREQSEEWAEDIKNRFHLWAKSKKTDVTGRNNFYQNTRLYGWQYGRDGDVFVRFTYSDDPELTNPVQIGFIDANQIRGDEYTFSLGPVSQNDGIIKDKNGKEIAYKVWTIDPEKPGRYKYEEIPAFEPDTGRPLIIHGFDPEYAAQSRGYPEISHTLQDFQDITTYQIAQTQKMVNSSSYGFTVENQLQDPSPMGLDALDTGSAGPQIVDESAETVTPSAASLGIDAVRSCTVNEATQNETGVYHLLGGAQGDKLVQIKSEGPAETSSEYMAGLFEFLSASVSMPSSIARMKFEKSHSASRGELGLFADVKEIKKDDTASDFLNIVYAVWLAEEIAAGKVRAPGWSDPLLRDAWLQNNWVGKPLPDVDPDKTMSAKIKALSIGLTELDREAMLYNGSSGKANRAKLARQILELVTDPFGISENPEPDEPDNEDEGE